MNRLFGNAIPVNRGEGKGQSNKEKRKALKMMCYLVNHSYGQLMINSGDILRIIIKVISGSVCQGQKEDPFIHWVPFPSLVRDSCMGINHTPEQTSACPCKGAKKIDMAVTLY